MDFFCFSHFYFGFCPQVELELRAQVRRFIELTGHLPHHMDGHQHVHVLPEPGLHNCPWVPAHLHTFYMEVEKDALDSIPVFKHYGIRWPDVYLGLSTMGQNMSVSSLQRALKQALGTRTSSTISRRAPDLHQPVITAELMVHPGYPSHPDEGGCGEGPDDFSQSTEREHELNMLRSPSVLELYCQEGVQLCGFRDL
uniref:Carbohydrate deacetylase n=1 Tax=Poecilia mexicana TaxID=48701 RepID=A0A3B3XDQ6_9TELE